MIIFSYYTDLLPEILLAKGNGVQIVIPVVDEVLKEPPQRLLEEADYIRRRSYNMIIGIQP